MEVEAGTVGEVPSKQAPPSIYMVPNVIRDLSPSSFTPKVVAIGPLHSRDEHLQDFQVQKPNYIHSWLERCDMVLVAEQKLGECVEKVFLSIEIIKACYAGPTTYNDLDLAMMMVDDALFILDFIQSTREMISYGVNLLIVQSIIHDLMLIENQIPFCVLEIVVECTIIASGKKEAGGSLSTHIEELLKFYSFVEGNGVVVDASAPDHILGFLHKYFRPVEPIPPVSRSSRRRHTATELDRAGINFKPHTKYQNWALAMKLELPLPLFHIFKAIPPFSWFKGPTLRMPKVHIGDDSESIFRNLIVYEQSTDVEKFVTAYGYANRYSR